MGGGMALVGSAAAMACLPPARRRARVSGRGRTFPCSSFFSATTWKEQYSMTLERILEFTLGTGMVSSLPISAGRQAGSGGWDVQGGGSAQGEGRCWAAPA